MNESDVWDEHPLGSEKSGTTFVTRTSNMKQAVKTNAVRDDWDADDDDDDEDENEVQTQGQERGLERGKEEHWCAPKTGGIKTDKVAPDPRPPGGASETEAEDDSHTIWEEANKRTPMPELIVASASTSQSFSPPPPAALQPTLRILKRPSPNPSFSNVPNTSSSPGPPSSSGSGSGSGVTSPTPRGTLAEREAQYQEARNRIFGDKDKAGPPSRARSSSGGVSVMRDPLGPMSEPEPEGGQDKSGRPAKGFGERRRGKKVTSNEGK